MNNYPYRLRTGDTVNYAGQPCTVARVTESSAVIAIQQPPRAFTTIFGKLVILQPRPALVRISPNSEIPILNR